jgi:hypothetical protein
MTRDMDLVRTLLIQIAADPKYDGPSSYHVMADDFVIEGFGYEEIDYHLGLMIEAGLLHGQRMGSPGFVMKGPTWEGHEFLDTVRDPEVWAKTKKGAAAAGGFTIDLLKDLAKGLVKKQIEEYTGVKL